MEHTVFILNNKHTVKNINKSMTKNYLLTFTCITLSGKVAKLIKYMIRYDATAESTQIHKY